MNKIKEFFKSRWIYKLTDNQIFAFEFGIVAMSMGAVFLLICVFPYADYGGIRGIITAGVLCVIGLAVISVVSYLIHKTREEIKRPE